MAQYVGDLPVFYDDETGTLQVDEDALRDAIAGDEDEYGDDDDVGDDDDDDVGDDDDDVGEDEEEVGFKGRGRKRRAKRKARRQDRREDRRERRGGGMSESWEFCIRSGSETTATGETDVDFTISNPSEFKCEDMSFEGSDTGAKVSQIWFGDDCVFNPGGGTPVSLFGPTSLVRRQLKGKICPSGANIRVVGTVASDEETLQATFTGKRLKTQSC